MDRLVWLLCTLGVIYATETTMDTNLTSATTIVSESTELPEAMVTSPIRAVESNIITTTEASPAKKIKEEERTTVEVIRSTESSFQDRKEQSTAKQELTTAETKKKSPSEEEVTTKVQPLTERSPLTTEARVMEAFSSTQASTPPSSRRPAQATHSPTTTTVEKTKKQTTADRRATTQTSTVRTEPTTQHLPPRPLNKTKMKVTAASSVQAKKGTSNASPMQQPKKRKQSSSKKDDGMSSLMYIPLMIQAQMMPMMLMQLKFFTLKALALGKLALIILGLNLLRNAIIGYSNDEQQYEHESLASAHYGYNGGPEYGSWVNRRIYKPEPVIKDYKPASNNFENRVNRNYHRINKSENKESYIIDSNSPYKAYTHQAFEKKNPQNR